MLLLMKPRTRLAFWLQAHIGGSCQASHPSALQSPSWQGCSQSLHPPDCIDTEDCPDSGAGPCIWPCWTSLVSQKPTSPACPGLFGWHLVLLACQLHHSAWCHLHLAEDALNLTVYVADENIIHGYVTSTPCIPSSSGCCLSCTGFQNLLRPLVNLNNSSKCTIKLWRFMGNSSSSNGQVHTQFGCNVAGWNPLTTLAWKFLYNKSLCYTGLSLAPLRQEKQFKL